jgi:hypothetical protein
MPPHCARSPAPAARVTASPPPRSTSVSVMANYFGSGIGFLVAFPVKSGVALQRLLWIEAGVAFLSMVRCTHRALAMAHVASRFCASST